MAKKPVNKAQEYQDALAAAKKLADVEKNMNAELKAQLNLEKQLGDLRKESSKDISSLLGKYKEVLDGKALEYDLQKKINNLEDGEIKDFYQAKLDKQVKLNRLKAIELKNVSVIGTISKSIADNTIKQLGGFTDVLGFLNDFDKSVRTLNKDLGLSGPMAGLVRSNLTGAAGEAVRMGASFEELAGVQREFSNETGRMVLLSSKSLDNIVAMGKGTAMGVAEASKMAGQFELIGKNADQTKEFYQGVVDSSERFGINTTNVIKKINENFKKAQQYVFKGGVKGLKDMAQFAEKFKVDMTGVFSAMDKARGLEGAVDMAAQLQVIGGEFAKADPFQLLFQARNDAAGFAKTMQGLTANLATYNKQTGEFDIAAGNLDRLRLAAEATGQPIENLIEQAKRGSKIKMIEGMLGGLTKDEKEFVSSIAEVGKNGKFEIEVAPGVLKDVRSLTHDQISALQAQKKTLEERAKTSQAFDEQFKNTINQLKTSLLPILNSFSKFIDSIGSENMTNLIKGLLGFAAIFKTAQFGLYVKGLIGASAGGIKNLFGGGSKDVTKGVSGGAKEFLKSQTVGKGGSSLSDMTSPQQTKNVSNWGSSLSKAAPGMLAFGAALLMIGGAVYIASKGIASLAESFKGLNSDQLSALQHVLLGMGVVIIGLGVAVGIAGEAMTAGAVGMLAFGGAVALIGVGIGVAAAGIGFLVKSFSGLATSLSSLASPDIIKGMVSLGMSLPLIALGMTGLGNPIALLGAYALVKTLQALSEVKGINTIGTEFSKLTSAVNTVDSDKLKQIKETAEAISQMNMVSSLFGGLNNLFGDGMIVRFADDEKVNLQVDITAEIDGERVANKISKYVPRTLEMSKKGNG